MLDLQFRDNALCLNKSRHTVFMCRRSSLDAVDGLCEGGKKVILASFP